MSEDTRNCRHCRYIKADPWTDSHEYHCVCEDSPFFAESLGVTGKHECCDCFETAHYSSMTLLEAMEIITGATRKVTNTAFIHDMKTDRSSIADSMAAIWFKTNKDLEDWRDAHARIFAEVMKLKKERGDFSDDTVMGNTGSDEA